jgi:glucose/arabinose dehydrogenase
MQSRFQGTAAILLIFATGAWATSLDPNFTESLFIDANSNIGFSTGLDWAPDGSGRLFVTRKGGFSGQQNAQVRIVNSDATIATTPFATESVWTSSECGIIGLCFDPDFVNNHYVYLFLTVSQSEQQIVRYTDSAGVGTSRTVIMSGLPTSGNNHDGGAVGIGNDGKLYWAIGDLGNGTGVNSDLTSLAAKIGRANRSGPPAPNDNPFFDGTGPNNDYIWARGFRNPFTLTFQRTTGQLWSDTVGTNWEQVFLPQRGDHAGYNAFENDQPAGFLPPVIAYRTNTTESYTIAANGAVRANGVVTFTTTGTHHFRKGGLATISGVPAATTDFNGTFPVAAVLNATQFTVVQAGANETRSGGSATTQNIGGCITGGCFYDSTAFPAAYRGNYFFGDYNSGRIMRVQLEATNQISRVDEFVNGIGSHVDMTTGPDGALYYADQSSPGTIRKLVYNGTAPNLIVQPTAFNVLEGGSSVVSVRLATAPASNVTVTTSRLSGDVDLSVSSGASLTFTPGNFSTPQLVTIAAAEDSDQENDSAVFRILAPGIATYDLTVNGIDNDDPQLVISTASLSVNEGSSNTFTVRLASPANLTVSVARTAGDTDVTVSGGATLNFTTVNFATPQTVTIAAAEDGDNTNDNATITVSASGQTSRNVAVSVTDNDPLAPSFTSSPVTTAVVNAAYTYDANAAGNPAPTFSLTSAPTGMSINATTGVINWTPTSTGNFSVTIQAANGVSPNATQGPFTITVSPDAPPTAVLTRPVAGEIMSGTNAEFFGDGVDDVSTVKAEFFVDNVLRYTDVNNGNHFHYGGAHTQFDTTQFTNGAHTLRMRVTDTSGQTGQQEVQVTIGNGGDAWRAQYFNLNDPNSEFAADPDHDGKINLLEYYLDTPPTIPELNRLPITKILNVGGTNYLTLQFVRANWATDVQARVEAGNNLNLWTQIDPADPTFLVSLQNNVPAFGLQTLTVRDILPAGAGPRFMRLRVTK